MKKRAQSQIITTILLIVLVLAAIIIVWVVVNNLITESAEGIGTSALTTQLDIKEATLYVTGGAKVRVKREVGEGAITALKFIFYTEDGESVIIEETEKIPKEIETKIYDFDIDEHPELYNINKVSVVPMFGKKSGMEFSEKKPNTDAVDSDSGLVSWWKFDGNARDSVGGNDGDLINNPEWVEGISGKALYFDGSGGSNSKLVLVSDSPSLTINNEITISMWIKVSTQDQRWEDFIRKGSDRIETGNIIDHGEGRIWANGLYVNEDLWDFNEWFYLTYVSTAIPARTELYINGKKEGENSVTNLPLGVGDLRIGTAHTADTFNGSIDDVMIFNQALTEEQIKAIYNNQKK